MKLGIKEFAREIAEAVIGLLIIVAVAEAIYLVIRVFGFNNS